MPPVSTTPQRPTTSTPTTSSTTTAPRWTPPPDLERVRAGGTSVAEGHRGPAVRTVQQRLNAAGADPPLAEDGAFGPLTRAAVERFQQQRGLEVDGRIGPRALAALDAVAVARPADGLDDAGRRPGSLPTPRPGAGRPATPETTRMTPRRGLSADATRPLPTGIASPTQLATREILAGTRGPEPRRALNELMASPHFRALPEASQARLLTTATRPVGLLGGLLSSPGAAGEAARGRLMAGRIDEATRLLGSPASTRMSGTDRARLVDVYAAAPGPQLVRLAGVGGPERLTGRDLQGGTMLQHLHGLATGPLAPGLQRGTLLRSTIAEVENPANIEQRQQGTCAATSVALRVAERSPAEYARIVAGLATPEGRVTLKDGSTLTRNGGSIADTRSRRSESERLVQDAFMGFANGTLTYDVAADTNHGEEGGGGLNLAEVSRLQRSVFGEPYRTVTTVGRQVTRDAGLGDRLWQNFRNNLDRLTFRHDPNSPMAVLRQELSAGRDAVIGMRWGQAAHSAHAVVVERIENGRVFFQNPHGNAHHGQKVGSSLTPPPRRVEGDNIQSMTLADFQQRLQSVSIRE